MAPLLKLTHAVPRFGGCKCEVLHTHTHTHTSFVRPLLWASVTPLAGAVSSWWVSPTRCRRERACVGWRRPPSVWTSSGGLTFWQGNLTPTGYRRDYPGINPYHNSLTVTTSGDPSSKPRYKVLGAISKSVPRGGSRGTGGGLLGEHLF